MCLTLATGNEKRKKAESDIIVYKYLYRRKLNNKIFTPYKYYVMVEGGEYKAKLTKIDNSIESGLHSLVNLADCKSIAGYGGCYDILICEFIIPKGAYYYEGNYIYIVSGKQIKLPSIASSRIIFNKILEEIEIKH
jgi:hypothetical protein